uniref:Probable E3 ubiquitin-protein ligase ATL44 n=1 Tax=Elaeis guineensis var. tenera TaxID=51953 RepID=A0A6I9RQA8_ELAGV|nr:probable E3 ubiquitin-protein ligase ATL44 [Elaeis guineensis]
MITRSLGFDDLRLERGDSTFRLSTNENNASIIRLHAFGKSDGRTTVAFHLTEGRRWLSSHVMSAVETGAMDDGSPRVFDKIFHPELRVLRSPSSSRESMKRMLLRLGVLCPEILEGCGDCFAFFGSAAAGIAAATGCSAVVVVVEISLFRVYDDSEDAEATDSSLSSSSSSSCSPAVEGLEKVEGREGSCCAICLEDFAPGMELARLPCLHVFHGSCVGKWLEERPACPLCRRCL